MNEMQAKRNTDRKYRLVLFFVIALTAISSAVREWHQIRAITQEVGQFLSAFSDAVVPTANARTPLSLQQTSEEFRWSGVLPTGKTIELRGINGGINAQPASGNQVEVVASKRSRKSDVSVVQIKVVEHSGGVTICAQYPTEDGSYTQCEPGDGQKDGRKSDSGRRADTRKNDVSVEFEVRVPQGVNLSALTINGDINAKSLMGNVVARTINGSIEVSTTGYAEATTINGGITARLGNSNWSGPLNFNTINGGIVVEMPSDLSADVDAQTLNGAISSDFPLTLQTSTKQGKNIRGKIGNGGRDLNLKTLNGSINLRISDRRF